MGLESSIWPTEEAGKIPLPRRQGVHYGGGAKTTRSKRAINLIWGTCQRRERHSERTVPRGGTLLSSEVRGATIADGGE